MLKGNKKKLCQLQPIAFNREKLQPNIKKKYFAFKNKNLNSQKKNYNRYPIFMFLHNLQWFL